MHAPAFSVHSKTIMLHDVKDPCVTVSRSRFNVHIDNIHHQRFHAINQKRTMGSLHAFKGSVSVKSEGNAHTNGFHPALIAEQVETMEHAPQVCKNDTKREDALLYHMTSVECHAQIRIQ